MPGSPVGVVNRAEKSVGQNDFLVVVLGDFGRDAAIKFCQNLSRLERTQLLSDLPQAEPFFDEYRRLRLNLIGDLAYVKAPWLRAWQQDPKPGWLDSRILVGFEGGLSPKDVCDRLALVALGALLTGVERGVRRAAIALPCNTLTPVLVQFPKLLASVEAMCELRQRLGLTSGPQLRTLMHQLVEDCELHVPSVPGAVIEHAHRQGVQVLALLGTLDIAAIYRREVQRRALPVQIVTPETGDQERVLAGIQACIEDREPKKSAACADLAALVKTLRQVHGPKLMAVEACTDLSCGVGLDSGQIYAQRFVDLAYQSDQAAKDGSNKEIK